MYSRLLILSFILCANSLFAQSHGENKKLQQVLNKPSDIQNTKPQAQITKRTAPLLSTTEDIRSQIKNRQELLTSMCSMSPIAGTTANGPTLQSRSIPNTKPTPGNVKLASDQPVEEQKIEMPKDILKTSNQGQ